MISNDQLLAFDKKFFGTKSQQQRYGQALMNEFHDDPDVAQHRSDSILWEAKTKPVAILRAQELGMLAEHHLFVTKEI